MICNCCGEDKKWDAFSSSGKRGYAEKCKECGVWLRLFAAAFGPSRKWHENRKKTAVRMREQRNAEKAAKPKPVTHLYQVFNIQPPKESYETTHCTILAQAAWPYRSTAGVCGVSV